MQCSLVYLFFSLRAVCSPLGRIYNIATNVSFVSCSFLRCFRCSFPCVFSLVYIVIVFVRCFICSFNRTVSFCSTLKIALELVNINCQWQLQAVSLPLDHEQRLSMTDLLSNDPLHIKDSKDFRLSITHSGSE